MDVEEFAELIFDEQKRKEWLKEAKEFFEEE